MNRHKNSGTNYRDTESNWRSRFVEDDGRDDGPHQKKAPAGFYVPKAPPRDLEWEKRLFESGGGKPARRNHPASSPPNRFDYKEGSYRPRQTQLQSPTHIAWIFCGLPGTGKDTVEAAMRKLGVIPRDIVEISTDKHIEQLAEREGKTYTDVFNRQTYHMAVQLMNQELDATLAQNRSFVYNRTNLSKGARGNVLQKLRGYRKVCIYIPAPNDEKWAELLSLRPNKIIDPVELVNMRKSFTPPTMDEDFDDIIEVEPCPDIKEFEDIVVSHLSREIDTGRIVQLKGKFVASAAAAASSGTRAMMTCARCMKCIVLDGACN